MQGGLRNERGQRALGKIEGTVRAVGAVKAVVLHVAYVRPRRIRHTRRICLIQSLNTHADLLLYIASVPSCAVVLASH